MLIGDNIDDDNSNAQSPEKQMRDGRLIDANTVSKMMHLEIDQVD